jgi:hypothetical protein
MNATTITMISTWGRDQHATNTTEGDERSGRDGKAGHSLRTAHLSRLATGTGGPCLPVCLPRTFKSAMSDKEARSDEAIENFTVDEQSPDEDLPNSGGKKLNSGEMSRGQGLPRSKKWVSLRRKCRQVSCKLLPIY